jgi:hypothetical protein
MVVTLAARNAKKATVVSAFGDSMEPGSQFHIGGFHRNLTSIATQIFSHSIYFNIFLINFVLSMSFANIMPE